jgi:hypothetical protein
MAELRWFHVVLTEGGDVVSCREVAKAGDRVFVFRAATAEAAIKQAINAHSAHLLAARRAANRAKDLCVCGRKRDRAGLLTCSRCLARHALHKERYETRQKGGAVAPLDRREVLRENRDEQRLALLLEVQEAWVDSSTNGQFTTWLNRQIEAAGGKRRAG